jgi:hypothetical protein
MTEIGKALRQTAAWWNQASADADMKSDAFYYCPV